MRWKKLPPSSLDKLVNAGKPIYIINTSSLPDGNKGMIVVNFQNGTQREFFKMPPTFIPMAISDVIPPKRLGESRDFKQSLVKGMLTLVDPDQAEHYLSTREAQDELDALVLSEHSSKAKGIDVENEVAKRTRVFHHTDNSSAGPVQDVSAIDTISNKVRGLIEAMSSGTKASSDVLVELRRHQSALKPVDLSYVVSNSSDAALTSWAKKALAAASKEFAEDEEEAPVKKVAKRGRPAKNENEFDFGDGDDKMTAEEAAADAKARAAAMESQALGGKSRIPDEINALMGGKR